MSVRLWPGMQRERLAMALRAVNDNAAQNSCVCDKTGFEPAKHRKSCWVYMARQDHRIVQEFIAKLEAK